jgi:hypothetical protein
MMPALFTTRSILPNVSRAHWTIFCADSQLDTLSADVVDDDPGAFPGQQPRDRPADRAASAGDDRNLALDDPCHALLPLLVGSCPHCTNAHFECRHAACDFRRDGISS